jgi:hypothetical protein
VAVGVVTHDPRRVRPEQTADLLRDNRDHVAGLALARDERRHPPQRALLGQELAQRGVRMLGLGHVTATA